MNNYFEIAEALRESAINIPIIELKDFLFLNGESVNNEVIINKNGCIYGPYYDIKKGSYKVKVTGLNLEFLRYDVVSNNEYVFETLYKDHNKNTLIYDVIFDSDVKNVEFRFFNDNDSKVTVSSIDIMMNIEKNINVNFLPSKRYKESIEYYRKIEGRFIFIKRIIRKACKFLLEKPFIEISNFNRNIQDRVIVLEQYVNMNQNIECIKNVLVMLNEFSDRRKNNENGNTADTEKSLELKNEIEKIEYLTKINLELQNEIKIMKEKYNILLEEIGYIKREK